MTCQSCGATIVPGTTQCAVCGTPVPTEPGSGLPQGPEPGQGYAPPPAPAGYGQPDPTQGYAPASSPPAGYGEPGPQQAGQAPPMHCRTCNTVLAAGTQVCPTCHQAPMAGSAVCWHCGAATVPGQPNCSSCGAQLPVLNAFGAGQYKSKIVAGLLALLLCGMGIHHFYLGNTNLGIAQLAIYVVGLVTSVVIIGFLIFPIAMIWSLVDGIRILTGSMPDSEGRPLV
jgi:TM2 domain-containing membrane protein YozV/RNA polymerase subunit RPABC4/transcription elongation factor Spt4